MLLTRTIIASLAALAMLCANAALANGYDVYAAPLAWSPDGRLLAAAVNATWPRDDTLADGALRLYGRNGEVVAELASGNCGSPSFSPDGKLLAAVVDGNLALFEVATGRPWGEFTPPADSAALGGKVLDCVWWPHPPAGGSAGYPNPDQPRGSIFYTAGERFYGCRGYQYAPDLNKDSAVWRGEPQGSVLASRPSPDGKLMTALMQDTPLTRNAAYERLVVWPSGGEPQLAARPQYRPDDYHESNALFLDASTVLFQRGGWGDWRLYTLNLASGQEYLELNDAQHPALDGSGQWLAYTRRDFRAKAEAEYDWDVPSSVRLRNRETRGDWLVSTFSAYAELPALSADGVRIAWLQRGREGEARVAVRTVAGLIGHGAGLHAGERKLLVGDLAIRENQPVLDDAAPENEDKPSTETQYVTLETTAGDIVLAVHPAWDGPAAAHFLELVDAGFYDGAPWFRVLDGFVAQCGIAADPAMNAEWGERTLKDGKRRASNTRGTVAFGKSGMPNSRSTHIYINYVDNSAALDPQDFSPFAEVAAGMGVAESLFPAEYNDQAGLAAPGGLEAFAAEFPEADYILRAYRSAALAEHEEMPEPEATTDPDETEVTASETMDTDPSEAEMAETTRVVLETTKGDIVIAVHNDWSPLGAAHFLELVKLGFYDGAPWFRVLDGFVAQCGIAADPALNDEWGEKTIKDDPVVEGNRRGNLAFGKTGAPHSRSTHIFINYRDNSAGLDPQGFSAFAEVVDGMDIADSLARCEFSDQYGLRQPGGMEKFKQRFPDADYIVRAYIQE